MVLQTDSAERLKHAPAASAWATSSAERCRARLPRRTRPPLPWLARQSQFCRTCAAINNCHRNQQVHTISGISQARPDLSFMQRFPIAIIARSAQSYTFAGDTSLHVDAEGASSSVPRYARQNATSRGTSPQSTMQRFTSSGHGTLSKHKRMTINQSPALIHTLGDCRNAPADETHCLIRVWQQRRQCRARTSSRHEPPLRVLHINTKGHRAHTRSRAHKPPACHPPHAETRSARPAASSTPHAASRPAHSP